MTELRRLSDKILAAHEQACREKKLDVAKMLLEAFEMDATRIGGTKTEGREVTGGVEDAYARQEKLEAEMK